MNEKLFFVICRLYGADGKLVQGRDLVMGPYGTYGEAASYRNAACGTKEDPQSGTFNVGNHIIGFYRGYVTSDLEKASSIQRGLGSGRRASQKR